MRYFRQLAVFLLLAIVCSALIWLVYTDIEGKIIANVNSEQMVHADQAAQGIERFFTTYNNTLTFLARDPHIIALDADGRHLMQEFFQAHEGQISSVTRVSESGIILYTYPYEGLTGTNISGQAHVRQELLTRKVVTSDVFTSVQGFRTVAVHMPVFDNGTYRGSIAILVPFDTLTKDHVEPIRILDHGYGWVVSRQSSTILFSPLPGQTGKPVPVVFADSPEVIGFVTLAMNGESGVSKYTLGPDQYGGRQTTYEAVYRSVPVGDEGWSIIVATPRDEILGSLQALQGNLIVIFLIIAASLFLFTYYIAQARGIIREEAKRKAAENALRESEANYRSIIGNLQDAFYRIDRHGTITMISPSAVQLIGAQSESDLLGKPVSGFYAFPEEREAFVTDVRASGSVTNREIRMRKTDGTIITVLATSHILTDTDGSFAGIEGILRDITDRKRIDTALQRATRKLNLLSTITTTNIRNTTFTLSGYLELEQQELSEERRREFHQKELVLIAQINHWLDAARTYNQLGLQPPKWQNVKTTFIYAISHLPLLTLERKIEIDRLEIYADPLLETVFKNMAENIILHAGTATLLTIRYEEVKDGLTLIFEDNGGGIPPEIHQTLFMPEFTPVKGVGLYMAREILEITGITIRETGAFGKGARFEIHVPREGYRFGTDNHDNDARGSP